MWRSRWISKQTFSGPPSRARYLLPMQMDSETCKDPKGSALFHRPSWARVRLHVVCLSEWTTRYFGQIENKARTWPQRCSQAHGGSKSKFPAAQKEMARARINVWAVQKLFVLILNAFQKTVTWVSYEEYLPTWKPRGTASDWAPLLSLTGSTGVQPFAVCNRSKPVESSHVGLFFFKNPASPIPFCSCLVLAGLVKKRIAFRFAFYPLPWWAFLATWLANHAVILNGIGIFGCKYIEYFIFGNGQWKADGSLIIV